MYGTKRIQKTISALEEIQQAGVTLAEATKSLHRKENVPFDDIWPAIMKIRQISEKEAMQLTKEWCGHWKNRKEY
jgi:hypothetical protein